MNSSNPTRKPQDPAADGQGAVSTPRLLVFSSLYPNAKQPNAGVFIRERMSQVARRLPIVVVAPVPWFPLQGLIRIFRPHYRPLPDRVEIQDGVEVYHPRFLAVPGLLRRLDGFSMALGSWSTVRRLRQRFGANIIDSHFAFPDGYAASLLSRWLTVPFTVTLRGTESRMAGQRAYGARIRRTLDRASCVIVVANALAKVVSVTGSRPRRVVRVANGVDGDKFQPLPKCEMRQALGLSANDPVLVSVGGLVPRKGFHRVIEVLPALRRQWPTLRLLVVGGASAEGNFRGQLERQVVDLGLQDSVRFLGALPPEEIKTVLSAADVFVLATANEGWANVFLEAMACGLPVVTTRVGGNEEVVTGSELGILVDFGDRDQLESGLAVALAKEWDRDLIRRYALDNSWDSRVDQLCDIFCSVLANDQSGREQ